MCQLAWVVVTAFVVVMPLVVAIVAEPVPLDGRELDTVVALFAATDAFAATSIARPIVPKAATLKRVATMRARAAA